MILPAALRYLALIDEAERRRARRARSRPLVDELIARDRRARRGQRLPRRGRGPRAGRCTRATTRSRRWPTVREVADKLEKVVADDLWPLPKYSEILFVR